MLHVDILNRLFYNLKTPNISVGLYWAESTLCLGNLTTRLSKRYYIL